MKRSVRISALLLALLLALSAPAMAGATPDPEAVSGYAVEESVEETATGESAAESSEEPVEAVPAEEAVVGEPELEELPPEAVDALMETAPEAVDAQAESAPEAETGEAEPPAGASEEAATVDPLAEAAGLSANAAEDAPETDDADWSEAEELEAGEDALPEGGDDNAALFDGYAARAMGLPGALEANRRVGLDLTGVNGRLYQKLADFARKVGAGEITSTILTLKPSDIGAAETYSAASLGVSSAKQAAGADISAAMGVNFRLVLGTLTADYPYDLYWFDKTRLSTINYSFQATAAALKVSTISVRLQVCPDHAAGEFRLSTERLARVMTAAARARTIVAAHKGDSDVGKVTAYVQEICRLVSYDTGAKDRPDYGGPWQVISVFDGDDSTNVVCEGYAKALKYLCELSAFSGNVFCYTMTGVVSGGASGGHMWNVVTLSDGRNYLVDPTLYDEGYTALLLASAGSVVKAGEAYSFSARGKIFTYTYDSACIGTYGTGVRALSTKAYQGSGALGVQSVAFAAGSPVRLVVGEQTTLRLNYTPVNADPVRLTWSSANSGVASVSASGVVTAKKAGTTTVTVRTFNEKTATIAVQVANRTAPTKVALNRSGAVTLNLGATLQLTAAMSPWNARSALKWKSTNVKVARISASGLVIPVAEGTAKVGVVAANGRTAHITVQVVDPSMPDEVRVWCMGKAVPAGFGASLLAGKSVQLTAQAYRGGAKDAAHRVTWASSNAKVATVSASGLLVTQGYGTATITAKSGSRAKLTFKLTVRRNRIDNITARPSAAAIRRVKNWAVALKSVEIVNANKVVAEFWFVNRRYATSKYLKDFTVNLLAPNGSAIVSAKAAKFTAAAKKNELKVLRATFTGSQIKNADWNLGALSTVKLTGSGSLY